MMMNGFSTSKALNKSGHGKVMKILSASFKELKLTTRLTSLTSS
jgi:hypothetical protein